MKSMIYLTRKQAYEKLYEFVHPYIEEMDVDAVLTEQIPIGDGGQFLDKETQRHKIYIGFAPEPGILSNVFVKESDFLKMCGNVFHELAYCDQFSDDVQDEVTISRLSKHGNRQYYQENWNTLPHEIDAEYNGVMTMWSVLEDEYSDNANILMFRFLHSKIWDTDKNGNPIKLLYVIDEPDGGFRSKEQVDFLFQQAYEKALNTPRKLPDGFGFGFDSKGEPKCNDEVSRLFMRNDGLTDPQYVHFRNKLMTSHSGIDSDKMMSSLVLRIRPELGDTYSDHILSQLDSERLFGKSVPEESDSIRNRLGIEADPLDIGLRHLAVLIDESPLKL